MATAADAVPLCNSGQRCARGNLEATKQLYHRIHHGCNQYIWWLYRANCFQKSRYDRSAGLQLYVAEQLADF